MSNAVSSGRTIPQQQVGGSHINEPQHGSNQGTPCASAGPVTGHGSVGGNGVDRGAGPLPRAPRPVPNGGSAALCEAIRPTDRQ